jgi:hypothetical protein
MENAVSEDGIPEDHKASIVSNGLSFLRAISECYGAEKGLELWEQIASVLDPNVKGEIFFAMISGTYNDTIIIKGLGRSAIDNPVNCVKAIRAATGLGLKDSKDVYDRLKTTYTNGVYGAISKEKIKVDPKGYSKAVDELRHAGFIL